jgi:fructose-1-phosphate kinase PfkB-like protein
MTVAMILCVTLNPCLDKTLTVPPWTPGDLVRGVATREVVGGKGNNVSRALRRLGRGPVPVTFLGGPTGASCESLLRDDDGLDPMVIPTAAPTRVILTVRTERTNEQTAFFDPDPDVTPVEADAMLLRIEAALRGDVAAMTLSGSSPSPATHGLFSRPKHFVKIDRTKTGYTLSDARASPQRGCLAIPSPRPGDR